MTTPTTPEMPLVYTAISDLRAQIAQWRRADDTIALVPTMGALHRGHLKLVSVAKTWKPETTVRVVVSIFVNPTQFAPHEDFVRYPRDLDADRALLKGQADAIWAPPVEAMFPDGASTRIAPGTTALGLETDYRPHFFGGVATVCAKLFTQVAPDIAVFGEKDYQQLVVVRQMVRDLDLPLEIIGAPTVRDQDTLALSSRNRYLTSDERHKALSLPQALYMVATAVHKNGSQPAIDRAVTVARAFLEAQGFRAVDYIAVRDAATLGPYTPGRPGRVLAAAWMGETRLIDNRAI